MRVVLRADASRTQGTGHVMRCLTLAEGLRARGHEIILITNASEVSWLEQIKAESELTLVSSPQHQLAASYIAELKPDWVVVDSYEISAREISALADSMKVLAIVDGNHRDINATMYLDHNYSAEKLAWPEYVQERLLAGSKYALIRDSILEQKRSVPWKIQDDIPRVVAFMGGSDPTGAIKQVCRALTDIDMSMDVTLIASSEWLKDIQEQIHAKNNFKVILPTSELPELLGNASIVISAAGTSSWEICTLGLPSVLISVVDNQVDCCQRMIEKELVLGINALEMSDEELHRNLSSQIKKMLSSQETRKQLSTHATRVFDGLGKQRVVRKMESLT